MLWDIKVLLISLSFVSYLYPVHSCVAYRRLRHSARSTRTRWTSRQNKRYLTVHSSFTVFNGHLVMPGYIYGVSRKRGFLIYIGGYVLVNIFCSLWIDKNKPCIFTSTSTDKSTRLFLCCFATKNPKEAVNR